MERDKFEALVARAIDELPSEFKSKLDNIDVVVEDWPTANQLREARVRNRSELLGLYEGIPQTRRGGGYSMVLPDRVTIFQKAIELKCHTDSEERIEAEVWQVVQHEIAHHFGISDETLRRLKEGRKRRS